MTPLNGLGGYSHYDWKSDYELFGFGLDNEIWDLYTTDINTAKWERLENTYLEEQDVHCLFSKDKKVFIGDNYPSHDGYRTIYHYSYDTNKYGVLAKIYSPMVRENGGTDWRCDLHNRWNTKGDKFSFDTIHNGKREIAEMDYNGI